MQFEVMRKRSLSDYGLCTVATAARSKRVSVATVRRWIKAGRLQVLIVGTGKREVWLLDWNELDIFRAPRKGRPGPGERIRRERLQNVARRGELARAGVPYTRKQTAAEDETVLALARRVAGGDDSAGATDRPTHRVRSGRGGRAGAAISARYASADRGMTCPQWRR
jgi:hypothetical protein